MTTTVDPFAREHLPPLALWPELIFDLPELQYPAELNCVAELLDAHVARGDGDRVAIIDGERSLTYAELLSLTNQMANVLVLKLGIAPGNRVLLRGFNNSIFAATWLAVVKIGAIAVATMPLLRARDLLPVVEKAKVRFALCDHRLTDELAAVTTEHPALDSVLRFGGGGPLDLEVLAAAQPTTFDTFKTAADDTCLIAFTSGTTGQPKGTMHFHRDVLAICDLFPRSTLRATRDDRFIGSPPLAFTFGLGALLLFPLRLGATAILVEKPSPDVLLRAIAEHRATICSTSPTAYRAMAGLSKGSDLTALRKCVSAGEALPAGTRAAWKQATGIELIDGIGATELLHIFLSHTEEEARPGATGKPIPGYQCVILDDEGRELGPGLVGRLAVKGPTGCRYLDDDRQALYVENGWNLTGDAYLRDDDGYFHYQARTDDMIISAGYNIAGPEIESALLTHEAVAECGVVGLPDEERGQIVAAFVVLRPGYAPDASTTRLLQDHVKQTIAPYKYPRRIIFKEAFPRTESGKLQRFKLRESL